MEPVQSCLGVCYTGKHLFYSVNDPKQDGQLTRIGSIDFNFDIEQAIQSGGPDTFPVLKSTLDEIRKEYKCSTAKVLAPASEECWSVVPKSVYDDTSEREAHIQLLMRGSDRSHVQATWFSISNSDARLLLLRDSNCMAGFDELFSSFYIVEYLSDFELGMEWQHHTRNSGSFLMVHCQNNILSVSSFILGKLRGCTFLEFDVITDLPYLWNLYADKLSWMSGMHDEVFIFGHQCKQAAEILQAYWYDHGTIHFMDTLQKMQVNAKEKTYGFRLESAFPAIISSLNLEYSNVEE